MALLKHSLCLPDAYIVVTVCSHYGLVGCDVIHACACAVHPKYAAGKIAIGERMRIFFAQDITAPGEIFMGHAQLGKKSGGNVALIHEGLYAFGLTDGTSQPEHGAVEEQGVFIALLVEMAVVRQYDNQ